MIDCSFLARRAQQLQDERINLVIPSTLSVIEQEDTIRYVLMTGDKRRAVGSLLRETSPGECYVIRDDNIRYAVLEDTKNIEKTIQETLNELAHTTKQIVALTNADLLSTYRGLLITPHEEPEILCEQAVIRKRPQTIEFIGDGLFYEQ